MPRSYGSGSSGYAPFPGFDDSYFDSLFAEAEAVSSAGMQAKKGCAAAGGPLETKAGRSAGARTAAFGAAGALIRESDPRKSVGCMPVCGMAFGDACGSRESSPRASSASFLPSASEAFRPARANAMREALRAGCVSPAPSSASRQIEGAAVEKPLSVSAAVGILHEAVAPQLAGVWIEGEVAEANLSSRGHVYFTLKDDASRMRCVMWRTTVGKCLQSGRPLFKTGDAVEVKGSPSVYKGSGALAFTVSNWRRSGVGSLYEAFVLLQKKLRDEGLFDADLKKEIPVFAKRVAVVTSAQAAAFADVKRTLGRRTPWVKILHFDASVQGADAPAELVGALQRADAAHCDVILLVRGGGAYEDLQAFNDEKLARAVFACRTPVISGVGHESDATIADFVADLRAATPTAAAEAVGPSLEEWLTRLEKAESVLKRAVERERQSAEQRFDEAAARLLQKPIIVARLSERLGSAGIALDRMTARLLSDLSARTERAGRPLRAAAEFLDPIRQRLLAVERRFRQAADSMLRDKHEAFAKNADLLNRSERLILNRAARRLEAAERLAPDPRAKIKEAERRLRALDAALKALDPNRPLRQGYALVYAADGAVATSAKDLAPGMIVRLRFGDGRADAEILPTSSEKA